MYSALVSIFIVIAITLITLILLQKGSDIAIGNSLRAGASSTFFGSSGSGSFLTRRITPFLAILFFFISLIIGNMNNHSEKNDDKLDKIVHLENAQNSEHSLSPSLTNKRELP
ncbi:Protein-export membrane protein SecG [Candidatus Erwinia haradaeae]|uniref:Protein-export membrane protein SecG n=1 Tax=Candidatus Erwinia haradaeae TaxID=1922217 RepID=A0A451D8J6_9GAMM|nr:Protein-export membrane protein SecG [Candidatus Erwinia haradaeae]